MLVEFLLYLDPNVQRFKSVIVPRQATAEPHNCYSKYIM